MSALFLDEVSLAGREERIVQVKLREKCLGAS